MRIHYLLEYDNSNENNLENQRDINYSIFITGELYIRQSLEILKVIDKCIEFIDTKKELINEKGYRGVKINIRRYFKEKKSIIISLNLLRKQDRDLNIVVSKNIGVEIKLEEVISKYVKPMLSLELGE